MTPRLPPHSPDTDTTSPFLPQNSRQTFLFPTIMRDDGFLCSSISLIIRPSPISAIFRWELVDIHLDIESTRGYHSRAQWFSFLGDLHPLLKHYELRSWRTDPSLFRLNPFTSKHSPCSGVTACPDLLAVLPTPSLQTILMTTKIVPHKNGGLQWHFLF